MEGCEVRGIQGEEGGLEEETEAWRDTFRGLMGRKRRRDLHSSVCMISTGEPSSRSAMAWKTTSPSTDSALEGPWKTPLGACELSLRFASASGIVTWVREHKLGVMGNGNSSR